MKANLLQLTLKINAIFALMIVGVTGFVRAEEAQQRVCETRLGVIDVSAAETIQLHMNDKKLGFAIADVPAFLTDEVMRAVYDILPDFHEDTHFIEDVGSDDVNALNFYGDEPLLQEFRPYLDWITQLLRRALPSEELRISYAEIRKYESGFDWQISSDITNFHKDGGYITVTIPFLGPGTEVITKDKAVYKNKIGQALILTAKGRTKSLNIPSTLHRAPTGHGEQRLVLVIRLRRS